jgi:hypothetical protein
MVEIFDGDILPLIRKWWKYGENHIGTTTRNKSLKQLQALANHSNTLQTTALSTIGKTCEFRHGYGIMNVPYARKETNRDYDGRISNSRRGRTNAQDIRGFRDATSATEEIAWIQDRRFVACGSERIARVSGKEEEYSRQKLKAGRIRLLQKIVASILLSSDWNPVDNKLDLCYLFTHYIDPFAGVSSPAVLSSTKQQWVLCGGREDTHMSITIGNPLSQVYPYDLNNSLYAIFGVHGSEVAG